MAMNFKMLLPHRVLLDVEAEKIVAEAENGSFGLLPRHIDFATALVPGLLSYLESGGGDEKFVAIDDGILVKRGVDVLVSTRRASVGADLGELQETIEKEYLQLSDQERKARSAMARLEINLAKRFIEFGKHD